MPTKSRFNWRHQYDDDRDATEGKRAVTVPGPDPKVDLAPDGAEQHHKDNVDLNVMMRRMGVTDGAIPPSALTPEYYGDFTEATDLRGVFDRVREATDRFNELPADLRARFQNDPVTLMNFISEPENRSEAVKLGLLSELAATEPAPDPAGTPAAPPPVSK